MINEICRFSEIILKVGQTDFGSFFFERDRMAFTTFLNIGL